jgi:hypothetical protein
MLIPRETNASSSLPCMSAQVEANLRASANLARKSQLSFDPLQLSEATGGHALSATLYWTLQTSGLLHELGIRVEPLLRSAGLWVQASGYGSSAALQKLITSGL